MESEAENLNSKSVSPPTFGVLLQKISHKLSLQGMDSEELIENNARHEKIPSISQALLDFPCQGAATLEDAGPHDIALLHNPSYLRAASLSSAGIILLPPALITQVLTLKELPSNFLIFDQAIFAFQEALEFFALNRSPKINWPRHQHKNSSRYLGSFVDESAIIDPSAMIGPACTIGPGVVIGAHTTLMAGCHLYPGVEIGSDCLLHAGVVIRENCTVQDRVTLQPNCVIGSCGFGYALYKEEHRKLGQLGKVILESDVEVGAGSTIDRGHIHSTIVQKGTKIDNLVQIAHGVNIGPHNLIISQSGIAGSATTGSHVTLAGQVGVNGHIHIHDRVVVAAKSGVTKSILSEGVFAGTPAGPIQQWRASQSLIKQLPKMRAEIKEIKRNR